MSITDLRGGPTSRGSNWLSPSGGGHAVCPGLIGSSSELPPTSRCVDDFADDDHATASLGGGCSRGGTPSIASLPTASSISVPGFDPVASYAVPFLPSFSHDYFQHSSVAYNVMSMLPRKLTVAWMPFATGMSYVHHFVERHGWRVDPVLLACSAFLLASKAENYGQVRIYKIVKAVFDLDPRVEAHKATASIRREQILTTEMMLLHTLDFNVVVALPYSRMDAQLAACSRETTPTAVGTTPLVQLAKKILAYTYMTPLSAHMLAAAIADGIITMSAEALGTLDDVAAALSAHGRRLEISPEELDGLKQTVYAVLVMSGKRVGIPAIDDLVRLQKKRAGVRCD